MKSIDEFPAADWALREKLPMMRPSTRERLLTWAVAQPGAMPWLLKRGALYWDKFVGGNDVNALDAFTRLTDATAALDLLAWRIEAKTDREAVEHLEMMNEKGQR